MDKVSIAAKHIEGALGNLERYTDKLSGNADKWQETIHAYDKRDLLQGAQDGQILHIFTCDIFTRERLNMPA